MEEKINQFELNKELARNRAEKAASETTLNTHKKHTAETIVAELEGVTLNSFNRPHKIKKPLKMRLRESFKRFLNKLKTVTGG